MLCNLAVAILVFLEPEVTTHGQKGLQKGANAKHQLTDPVKLSAMKKMCFIQQSKKSNSSTGQAVSCHTDKSTKVQHGRR